MTNYLVATTKPWNIEHFHTQTPNLPGNWFLITEKDELTLEYLETVRPAYVFFPHWSWIVSESVVSNYECVCIHMADLPYGRGGSPLQNLIMLGHKTTKLTALKMTSEVDAGPVYKKVHLSLIGSAQEIFEESAKKSYQLIKYIIENKPRPKAQVGNVTMFERRKPEQSEFRGGIEPSRLYDLIRMLDAETYPHAYSLVNDYRLTFTNASKEGETVKATVTFEKMNHFNE